MIYHNQKDETLVMLTLAGEKKAYEALVERHEKAVLSKATSITKNSHLAEDAAQDAFVTAWIKLDKLSDPQKFGGWVLRIAHNCALNAIRQMKSFLPCESAESIPDNSADPAEILANSDENKNLRRNISHLPEKVRQIISLHYFEDLTIDEIAQKMGISSGTVKRQLHDGRKKIRKELCAMNEEYSDTLLQKVMKKVEELKKWQFKNSKNGFETVYKSVLKQAEELSESEGKHHALADLLMRGWWWIPGEKNDKLFERIKESAILGKNEEVMDFIVSQEARKMRRYNPQNRAVMIEFRRDKQIPYLEKTGLALPLAREWFYLGYDYFMTGEKEKAQEAFGKASLVQGTSGVYHALVGKALIMLAEYDKHFKDKNENSYSISANVNEFRYDRDELLSYEIRGCSEGYVQSGDTQVCDIFTNAARCDGKMFCKELRMGEKYIATDGATLTFEDDNAKVETPSGTFEGCQKWVTRIVTDFESSTYTSYFKDGVGIVRFEHTEGEFYDSRTLAEYKIVSGEGLLPCGIGNSWKYADEYEPSTINSVTEFEITHSDSFSVIIASYNFVERLKYNENLWQDMIQKIRNEYYCAKDGKETLCDVHEACNRAESLAKTPMQKAHTKAACSVVRRIMDTDKKLNPNRTATGHWNFFNVENVIKRDGRTTLSSNGRWSFEWKNTGSMGDAETPLLFNNIYGILHDATNCIWNDEWEEKDEVEISHLLWDSYDITTKIKIDRGITVETKAGVFDDCIRLSLDISGLDGGLAYIQGEKTYYFAKGIGIVRTENKYSGSKSAVYELSYYEIKGDGYMPIKDGMVRRYEAKNLTDGFVGESEYTYVKDHDGNVTIFCDKKGIRILPPPITSYSSIQNEVIEDELWEEGHHDKSRARHDANNFHLLAHFLCRPSRYWARPEKAVAWNKYRLRLAQETSSDGKLAPALIGFCTMTAFRTACALFGCSRNDEGYAYLDIAFDYAEKWCRIEDGEPLDVGDPMIYGGVKLLKNKEVILLPDGTYESFPFSYGFSFVGGLIYYGLVAKSGWEWFNGVREEEKYKEYMKKAKELADRYSKQ